MSITFAECVSVDLGIQNVQRMSRILLSNVACSALPNFSILSPKKRQDIRKKVIEHKMCVLIFYTTLSETCLIVRRTERDMIKEMYRVIHKSPPGFPNSTAQQPRQTRQKGAYQ